MKYILIVCFASLAACASSPKTEEPAANANAANQTVPPETAPMPTGATVAEALKPPAETAVGAAPEPEKVAAPAKTKSAEKKGVDAKHSLRWLKNGNTRFVKGFLRKDGQGKKDIARVAGNQSPHAVVFSCSDSRVPPEIVFDQKLGEIYVVRSAGLALDKSVVNSIEYAVENLGPRLVLVMGHTASESTANPQNVAEELKKMSAVLRAAVERGDVEIKHALYQLNTGAVSFE